ncbi:aspartate aminotransferase family protein [Halocalculus aciditolerans]|uniref:Aspartate aminotransferase family protein n=1 Tax=Halocalculus aciditolerans TaxID=1383812 RepID=A0A830FNV1_9EURY|nr:aspartate aminotransferase family protein [Halocalculus aciditolerans]GGL65913.1 aspartate aminotransferase family protein [Halocalculus aciditolerans]
MRGPPIDEIHFDEAPAVDEFPGPKARELLDRQKEIDSNAVAYPDHIPLVPDEAKGATIRDVDGNVFLDFFAGIGVLNVGHANPYVMDAVHEQADKLVHTVDFPSEPRLDLIEKLEAIAPGGLAGNSKVVFGGPTGSDAIEAAIKLAKYNTGGSGLVAFRGSYHGATSGAMSITGKKDFKEPYAPLLPNVQFAPYPHPFEQGKTPERAVADSLREVRAIIEEPYGGMTNPAGIFVEPIQGEGGVVTPPEGFLSGLREIADDNDLPLVVDEIQAGLGRTGEWWASDHYDVTPDIVTTAKALGGVGFPLSATIYHEDLDTWGPGDHAGTYRGHVVAMRAGLRALEYVEEHDLLAHARRLGDDMRSRLRDVDAPAVGDVRGKGLFVGVEFVDGDGDPAPDAVKRVQEHCYENGVLVWKAGQHGNVLRLLPPLVLTDAQAEAGLDVLCDAIERVDVEHAASSASR